MTCSYDRGYTCSGGYPQGAPGCNQHFGSLAAFDAHHVHTGRREHDGTPINRCASPDELRAMGYHLADNGVWKTVMDEALVARLRGHPSVGDALANLSALGLR